MDYELRRQARMAMRGVPERLGLRFAQGNIEMRAKPNGTAAGSNFEWRGYATVYNAWFPMWDQNGEPFEESVETGAAKRSLMNPNLDVPFLVGHNDAGIPLARTKSGTMRLSDDSHGVFTHVPAMDGRREEVRALASAVERGDLDEMSLAFVCLRQAWDDAYERRTVQEMDIHRGDVCAVTHGANPATAGAWMTPVEQLSFRRPAAIGGPVLLERRAAMMHNGHVRVDPDGDGDCDACPEGDTDHDYWSSDGRQLKPLPGEDRAAGRPYELRAQMSAADINDLPDSAFAHIEPGGSKDSEGKTTPRNLRHYPVHDEAHAADALGRAAAQIKGGDADAKRIAQAAMPKIRAAAKKFGIAVSDQRAAAWRLLERLASAMEDMNLSSSSDYNPAGADHPYDGPHTHDHSDYAGGTHSHEHTHDGDGDHDHDHVDGTSANVMVDDATGIPGEETQFSAARKLELRLRELDMAELASRQ